MLRRCAGAFSLAILAVPLVTAGQSVSDPALVVQSYATGLAKPTGIAFIPGSLDALAIEKETGQVRRVNAGGGSVSGNVLDLAVNGANERGLVGIAFDPAFASNRNVYLYYSASHTTGDTLATGDWLGNRLSRFTLNAAGTQLTGETVLATFGTDGDGQNQGGIHNGGPLAFGPDGYLYGVTGDLNRVRVEQNQNTGTSSLVGGVYRIDASTGAAAPGNPFGAHADSNFHRLFAYGIRNSFGMAFDPVNGNLWDTENGPSDMDEINLVAAGFNSGWSQIMGPDSRDAQNAPGDLVMLPGASYSDPEFSYDDTIGVTAIEFLSDSILPGYSDAVVVSNNNLGTIHVLRLNASRTGFVLAGGLADLVADSSAERNTLNFGSGFGPTTDLEVGPDGALYTVSYTTGVMSRIVPEPTATLLLGVGCLSMLRRRVGRH